MGEGIRQVLDRGAASAFEQLQLLAELGQELAQSIDIDQTLARAVDRIADYMNAEAASVFLVEGGGSHLECRASAGPVNVTGLKLEMGQGIVGRAAVDNACQLVRDVRQDPAFSQVVDRNTGFTTRSMVCAPLNTAAGVIGVLQVLNKRDGGLFDDHDRNTLRILAAPTALAINSARMAADLVEQKQLKKELFMARRLQRSLLPPRRPEPFPVIGVNLPARQVSGDFYDYFLLDDGRIGFAVGDVSGKGMNAALLMVQVHSLLRWLGKSGLAPGRWLADVNNELLETVSHGMFVCALAGYYCPRTGTVTWANAGFPPALVREADGSYRTFRAEAPPLGILRQDDFPQAELDLSGRSMYLYSDGVSEIRDADGQMIEDAGFRTLIDRFAERSPKRRLGGIIATLRKLKVVDDTTILMLDGTAEGAA